MALGLAATVAVATPALANPNGPLKANKFLSMFVRAYNQCTSPTTTHNAPLSFGACTPVESSTSLKWGPKGQGQAKGTVKTNTLKQATDVALLSKFGDVRNQGDDSGFSGTLLVVGTIRTTDNYCVTDGQDCTAVDLPFPVSMPCGTAAVPPLAPGKCAAKTSANATVPGVVVPGQEANVELQTLQVLNGADLVFVEGLELH
jgi:hypothetical protein